MYHLTYKLKKLFAGTCLMLLVLSSLSMVSFAMPADNGPAPVDDTTVDCSGGNGSDCNSDCIQSVCTDPAANPDAKCTKKDCDIVKKYVNPLISVLSISIGIIAVISIIIGAITYTTSAGDPQKTSAAKKRLGKTVFALIFYFFFYAFLQFIIPGGAF